jgi:hypothetical protein
VATEASLVEQVIARCSERRFTGLLRVQALEGKGELSFLSGIRDTIVFDASDGDEALERLIRSTTQEFEAIPRLPPFNDRSSQPLAQNGPLGPILRPVNLMRYCESQSLTCTLDLNVEGRAVRINYELGDLTSVEPESADISGLLEATAGNYRVNLPPFELPEAARRKPAPAPVPVPIAAQAPAANRRRPVETVNATPRAAAAAAARDGRIEASPALAIGGPVRTPSATIPASRSARSDRDGLASSSSPPPRSRPPALPHEAAASSSLDQRPLTGDPRPAAAPPGAERRQSPAPFDSPASKARPPALPEEPAPGAATPAAAMPGSPRPGRPEYLVSTQRSGRRAQSDRETGPRQAATAAVTAPPAAARGGKNAASLEPWSPPSGPLVRDAEPDQRQPGKRQHAAPSSQRYYFWFLLALAVLGVLAYLLLG